MEGISIVDGRFVVTLAQHELHMAAQVGCHRHIEALAHGRPDQHGFTGLGWSEHIEGACGELAFAKMTNLFWDGSVNTFKQADVGTWQIRTRSEPHYELIVRSNDSDSDRFVLVLGRAPSYTIYGWIQGIAAKKPAWLKRHGGRPPAYFVPQLALNNFYRPT